MFQYSKRRLKILLFAFIIIHKRGNNLRNVKFELNSDAERSIISNIKVNKVLGQSDEVILTSFKRVKKK